MTFLDFPNEAYAGDMQKRIKRQKIQITWPFTLGVTASEQTLSVLVVLGARCTVIGED